MGVEIILKINFLNVSELNKKRRVVLLFGSISSRRSFYALAWAFFFAGILLPFYILPNLFYLLNFFIETFGAWLWRVLSWSLAEEVLHVPGYESWLKDFYLQLQRFEILKMVRDYSSYQPTVLLFWLGVSITGIITPYFVKYFLLGDKIDAIKRMGRILGGAAFNVLMSAAIIYVLKNFLFVKEGNLISIPTLSLLLIAVYVNIVFAKDSRVLETKEKKADKISKSPLPDRAGTFYKVAIRPISIPPRPGAIPWRPKSSPCRPSTSRPCASPCPSRSTSRRLKFPPWTPAASRSGRARG
jgi:hypothetical protein